MMLTEDLRPLLDWIQQVKESQAWPPKQQDIPLELQPLYQLYREHKAQLSKSRANATGGDVEVAHGGGTHQRKMQSSLTCLFIQ